MFDFLTKLFRKSEQPKPIKTNRSKKEKYDIVTIGRYKYFSSMDEARNYVRNKYKGKNWTKQLIAEDLNSKGFRTITKRLFSGQSVSYYLLSEDEWLFQKELRKEYDNIRRGAK